MICCECSKDLGNDIIDYCDYRCTVKRIIRLGLEEARKRD